MQAHLEANSRNVLEVLARRRITALVTAIVGIMLAIAVAVIVKPNYGATAHLLLVNDTQGRDPQTEGGDLPTIATSATVLDRVRATLHLDMPIETLRRAVTVKVAPKSSIMTIGTKDHNPAQAIAITNAVAENFTSFYSSVSGGRYASVISQLRLDLDRHRARLQNLEARLQRAAADSSYVGSQTSLDNTANNLDQLVTQRTMAYAQLVSDKAELAATRSQPGQLSKIIRHETLVNDQNYHQLEIGVSHDVANLAIVKASYTDNYPGLAGAQSKVNGEQNQLKAAAVKAIDGPAAYSPSLGGQIVAEQRAHAAVDGDDQRVKALDSQIATNKLQLQTIPGSGVNVGAIRALRDAEEAQYGALSLRLTNAQANSAEANSLGSVVVIDRAEDAEPTLLGTNALLVLCLLLALAMSVGAAYLAEALNPRFITPNDIESVYGRPVVGSINSK